MTAEWPPLPTREIPPAPRPSLLGRPYTTDGGIIVVVAGVLAGLVAIATGIVAFGGTSEAALPPDPAPTSEPTTIPTTVPTPLPTATPAPTVSPQPDPTAPPTPAPPTPTAIPPAPAPTPVPPAPTPPPQPFQPVCSISKTEILVGERTQISGTHVPDSVTVTWTFDHGDGYSEQANPSFAQYSKPGTYTVTGHADVSGGDVRSVPCGSVTVTGGIEPVTYHCSISATRILEGGTTTFTGTTQPANLPVTWVFDHGDGYREQANPSVSLYTEPGFYSVLAEATYQERTTIFECGTVEVIMDTRPITVDCSNPNEFIGLRLTEAKALANQRGCPHRIIGQPGSGDYRPERLNFLASGSGPFTIVVDVRYG